MNVADQEQFFTGVDANSDPALLRPGYVSDSQNRRFVNGVATPRKGAVIMPWANKQADYYDKDKAYSAGDLVRYSGFKTTSVDPPTRVILTGDDTSDGVSPTSTTGPMSSNLKTASSNLEPAGPYFESSVSQTYPNPPIASYDSGTGLVTLDSNWSEKGALYLKYPGTILGASNFETPNGIQHLIVATDQGVFATSPDSFSEEIKVNSVLYGETGYPTLTSGSKVRFVQCFNVLIMFRGDLDAPLELTEDFTAGFQSITQTDTPEADENPDDGTEQIPNASTGLFFGNRLVIPFGRDEVAVSDYLNYTRYQPVRSAFRVNTGSSDRLVAVFKFDPNTLLVFKSESVYAVRNVYGDLVDATLDQITDQYGCAAERSVVSAGSDVIFLSDQRGVVSIRQSVAGETQSVDVPLSQPIQPIIDRIDWSQASDAVGAYANNRYYLAVPLRGINEGVSGNNAILVYDFAQKAWASTDFMTGLSVKDFFQMTYKGAKRFFVLTGDGQIMLYDDEQYGGDQDQSITSTNKIDQSVIEARLLTRGFTCGIPDMKRFKLLAAFIESNAGAYTIKGHADGQAESIDISDENFSKTQYGQVSQPDYFADNRNNNFLDSGREDYSILASDGIQPGSKGFRVGIKQAHADRDRFNLEGSYLQLEFKTTSGVVDIRGLNLAATTRTRLISTESE